MWLEEGDWARQRKGEGPGGRKETGVGEPKETGDRREEKDSG